MKYLTTTLLLIALTGGGMAVMTPVIADQHGMHMMPEMGKCMYSDGGWKSTLTDEQKKQVAKLKLEFKKKVYPIKAKIKQAKIEKALLITVNKPNQKDIDEKIDEIIRLKAEKMRLKSRHKIEVRKVLNEDQRVLFDLKMLKKAYRGKKGYRPGCH